MVSCSDLTCPRSLGVSSPFRPLRAYCGSGSDTVGRWVFFLRDNSAYRFDAFSGSDTSYASRLACAEVIGFGFGHLVVVKVGVGIPRAFVFVSIAFFSVSSFTSCHQGHVSRLGLCFTRTFWMHIKIQQKFLGFPPFSPIYYQGRLFSFAAGGGLSFSIVRWCFRLSLFVSPQR